MGVQSQAGFESNVKRYKTCLVANGFTQTKGIDYKKTFSLIFMNDSFRIIMALATHFDLQLHQMDINTVFPNGSLRKKSM